MYVYSILFEEASSAPEVAVVAAVTGESVASQIEQLCQSDSDIETEDEEVVFQNWQEIRCEVFYLEPNEEFKKSYTFPGTNMIELIRPKFAVTAIRLAITANR